MRKRVKINPSKYRVLLSDVLPYEIPLFFSNRNFYKLINKYQVKMEKGKLLSNRKLPLEMEGFMALINGNEDSKTRNFIYKIAHNSEGRELTIIHPLDQISFANFYNIYNSLILYYCNKSRFSLRYPYKVAMFKNKPRDTANVIIGNQADAIDEENLKHYFAYKKLSNINGFYQSYDYQRAEKKFKYLFKLDAKKCFESISIESISKAVMDLTIEECKNSMPYHFAKLMKSIKQEEQNGIVIGPEFSRIFAELIYQEVDKKVELDLLKENLFHKKDYEYYRYVDDGFLFYNDINVRHKFVNGLVKEMKKYGLKLNSNKIILVERPFSDKKAVAKNRIEILIKECFTNKLETVPGILKLNNGNHYDYITPYTLKANSLIDKFKIIVLDTQVKYKDISSFTLNKIEYELEDSIKKIRKLLEEFKQAEFNKTLDIDGVKIMQENESEYIKFLNELIDYLFFLFANDKRTSSSISLTRIIVKIQKFVTDGHIIEGKSKLKLFDTQNINLIQKKIKDEISFIIQNNKTSSTNQIDLMFMLIIQKNVHNKFKIDNYILEKILFSEDENRIRIINKMNYLSIFAILHYIEGDSEYENIRTAICEWVENKVKIYSWDKGINDTETLFSLLDSLSCPYFTKEWKIELIRKYKIPLMLQPRITPLIYKKYNFFVKWYNFSTFDESNAKRSQEVY